MPVVTAKKVLIAAKQKAAAEEQAALLQQDVFNLAAQVDDYSRIVNEYKSKDSIYRSMSTIAGKIYGQQEGQRNALQAEVARLNKELRKSNRRTKVTALAGLLAIGLTIFIMK
jgi:hypothetical protein